MGRSRPVFFSLAVILLVGSFAQWRLLQTEFIWRWAAEKLLSMAQSQINGTITVEKIEGGPLSGLIFHGVSIASPEEEVLRLKRLEISLSPWSLLKLQLTIGKLVMVEPNLYLAQDKAGHWNASRLIPEREEPPSKTFMPFRAIIFQEIVLLDGEVLVTQEGQKRRYHNLDLDMGLRLDHPTDPEQTLTISDADGAVTTPQGRFAVETDLTYKSTLLDLKTFTLKGEQDRYLYLTGKAESAEKLGDINFRGELGPLRGGFINQFWSKWPASGDVSGTFEVTGTSAQVHLSARGKIHEAPFTLTGLLAQKAGKWHYDASLDLKDLPPEILGLVEPSLAEKKEAISPVSVHIKAQGIGFGWPPEQFAYTVETEPLTYGNAQVERLRVVAAGDGQKQDVQATLQGNFGEISLAGKGSFFTAPSGDIILQTKAFRPDILELGAPEETRLDFHFAGSFQMPDYGSVDRLKVTGEVEASGQVGGQPLRELKGRLAWDRPDLSIPFMRVHLGNLQAELKGALEGERLNFTFTGGSTPRGSWPIPAAVEGQLNWQGTLTGTVGTPVFSLNASGRRLVYETYGVQSFRLTARGTGLPPRPGFLDFQATRVRTPAGVFARATFRGTTEGELWRFRLDASSPKGPQIELAGSAAITDRPFEVVLDTSRFSFQKISGYNQGPVRLRFLPGFELEPATLVINKGTVRAQARLRDDEAAGNLELSNIPLEIAGQEDLQGRLHGEVALTGTLNSPVIDGTLRLEPAQWRYLTFTMVKTGLNYREAALDISGSLNEEKFGARAQWDGRLPLVLSFSPFRMAILDEEMSLRVRGEEINLGILAALSTEVEEAEAPVDFTANAQGTWNRPQVTGQVRWGGGHLRLRQTGARYRLEPGEINLQGNRVTLPQITLVSEGTATLRGEARLAGFVPEQVQAQAQFANFKVLDRLRSEAFLNGNINADGPWEALVVRGRLTIPEATLTPQILQVGEGAGRNPDIILVRHRKKTVEEKKAAEAEEQADFMKGMSIAVSVDAPGNVWVKDKRAEMELAVDLRINKRPRGPVVPSGQVRVLQGDLNIQGREFEVVRGFVDLPETPGQEPYIQGRAVHETWDVTIIVDVSGTPNNPQIDLSSEPSLPKSEILSYLVFGRPSSALSQEEFSASKLAGGTLGGITAQKIQDILGPDFPILGDVTVKAGQEGIGIVKPLGKGVALTLGRESPTTPGEKRGYQAQLQYRVNRNITVEGQAGGNPGGDVFFNYDF
ncbi:MAG: translocation/assembly module TamB domain-containing protein [Deltaproteobacteria bacterium]|nr:translocation/assembly module TamB domain-containing protein [Deltaproteobacteria bacterium]